MRKENKDMKISNKKAQNHKIFRKNYEKFEISWEKWWL